MGVLEHFPCEIITHSLNWGSVLTTNLGAQFRSVGSYRMYSDLKDIVRSVVVSTIRTAVILIFALKSRREGFSARKLSCLFLYAHPLFCFENKGDIFVFLYNMT